MYDDITGTQQAIYDFLVESGSASAGEIAEEMCYSSTSVVYDHVAGMRERGVPIVNNNGEYYIDADELPHNNYKMNRQGDVAKQTITRKANEFFAELERIIKPRLDYYEPPVADGGLVRTEDGLDLIIQITDTHIGDLIEKREGNQFDTPIAVRRIKMIFEEAHAYADELGELGYDIDTVHVLLGGDIVTNEVIYNGQTWEIDSTVKTQMFSGVQVLDKEICKLAARFPSVQVVCQNGNHGEFRVDGASEEANADDFVYAIIDYIIRREGLDNITVVNDEYEQWHTNFPIRDGKWTGHLRHGQKTRGHIGTSSPQSDWLSWAREYEFDVAFYGHYHQYKEEPLPDGTPVIMGGSIKPPDHFAAGMAAFNGPMTGIHTASDEQVLKDTRRIHFR